jgi:hypothetical protein
MIKCLSILIIFLSLNCGNFGYYKYEVWQEGKIIDYKCMNNLSNTDQYSSFSVYYKNTFKKCK